jgi:hypothetical protein
MSLICLAMCVFSVHAKDDVPAGMLGVAPVDWVALVKLRAKQRWDALVEGRFEDAYGFLSPAQRKVTPFAVYRRGVFGRGVWTGAEVENATCDDVRCIVTTRVQARLVHPRLPEPLVTSEPIKEVWVKDAENMQLWFVPNK